MGLPIASTELAFALDAARTAGLLARRVRSDLGLMRLTKTDLSPVTVGDFALQAVVAEALSRAFPDDRLVAEESSRDLRANEDVLDAVTHFVKTVLPQATPDLVCEWIDRGCGEPGGRFWVLDPIDGTKGYIRGGQYAVAFALICDGRVHTAVLACPHLGEDLRVDIIGGGAVAVASRGAGAWLAALEAGREFRRLRVSDISDTKNVRLLRSHEDSHTNAAQTENIANRLGVAADPVKLDSQAKFAILAGGRGDLLLRLLSPDKPKYKEKIWDIAAGSLVVEEAGGRVSDLDGRPLDFTAGVKLERNRGIMASNGLIHDRAVKAIQELGY